MLEKLNKRIDAVVIVALDEPSIDDGHEYMLN